MTGDTQDAHVAAKRNRPRGLDAVERCVEAAVTALPAVIRHPEPAMDQEEEVDNHRNAPLRSVCDHSVSTSHGR